MFHEEQLFRLLMMQEHFEHMFCQGLTLLKDGSCAAAIKVFAKCISDLPYHESFMNIRVAACAHKGLAHIQLDDYKSAAETFSQIPHDVSLNEDVIPQVLILSFLLMNKREFCRDKMGIQGTNG